MGGGGGEGIGERGGREKKEVRKRTRAAARKIALGRRALDDRGGSGQSTNDLAPSSTPPNPILPAGQGSSPERTCPPSRQSPWCRSAASGWSRWRPPNQLSFFFRFRFFSFWMRGKEAVGGGGGRASIVAQFRRGALSASSHGREVSGQRRSAPRERQRGRDKVRECRIRRVAGKGRRRTLSQKRKHRRRRPPWESPFLESRSASLSHVDHCQRHTKHRRPNAP